jgi:SAM-dependent methyltransferase
MNWKKKAFIMKLFDTIPNGDVFYEILQKSFGRLNADPTQRIPQALDIIQYLENQQLNVKNKVLLEVGTGHIPIIPICLFLAGAKKIYTYDLNKRLQLHLTSETLSWFLKIKNDIKPDFLKFIDETEFEKRFCIISDYQHDAKVFLEKSNIVYTAPGDAAKTNLPNESIDIHFSCTVFEHIPYEVLVAILTEAKRILKNDGLAVHLIDPSDHFEHQDKSISKINFLQYTENEWNKIGGNQFAYCNRLRYPDFQDIISASGFNILSENKVVDELSLEQLKQGFVVDSAFINYSPEALCTTRYDVVLAKKSIGE